MSTTEQLRAFRAFEGFSLQQLAALAAEGEERDVKAGETVFREGEEARDLIFLLRGKLEVRSRGAHISDIPPLNMVGEMGVLRHEPRIASVVAMEESTYLALAREDFQRLTESDPDLGMKFYRNLCTILMEQLKKNNLVVEFFQALGT
ncbi:MAG TPA: cyclic nucleotide-binding domain-containing protein [Bdellovibrionota bacterium]